MHIAAWHRQTPESKFTKFGEEMSIGQTHNHTKFCRDPKEVSQISMIKNLCSWKSVSKFTEKSLKTCYLLKPPSCQISLRSVKPPWREALQKFSYTVQYFSSPGGPLGQMSCSGWWGTHPLLATCKILSHSDDPSQRYLLPNFVDFVAGMTHKINHKQKNIQ